MKKQAGKDPWGAQGRKRREAEMARANARKRTEQARTGKAQAAKVDKAKAGTAPGTARNQSDARGRSRSPQPETPRTTHTRETKNKTVNSRRRILVGLLVVMALAIVGYILSGPLLRNLDASAEIQAKQVEFEKEQAKTEDLRNRKAQANDMKFLEEEARRIGYVLPGEIPVIVVEDAPPESTDGNPAQSTDNPTANPNP